MIINNILTSDNDIAQDLPQYFATLDWTRLVGMLSYNPSEPLLFSSGLFLFIFLAFTLVYMALHKALSARLLFVTLFSYYFFYKSSGLYFLLLVLVTITDFYIAKGVKRQKDKADEQAQMEARALDGEAVTPHYGKAKWLLALSLLVNLCLLCYFKYTNFFAGMIAQAIGNNFQPWDIFLPVGISFYTFKTISYVVDVYRGKIAPMNHLLDYAFYVSFFPTLLAGPIVRATDFAPQIRRPLQISNQLFATGAYFVLIGLAKKCIISDYIAQNFVDRIFDNPTLFSGGEVLLGLYGYTVQIYCDFSGYSDMAIGISALLGFTIPMNFNAPWKADSVSDFWRRWHLSLSSWIRDYVYIPLGGSRKGTLRMYLNQMIAMVACGLWHGASLSFIVWGALHGALVCIHKFFSQNILHHDRHYHPQGWRRVVAVVITFHIVCLTWLFFRNATFEGAWVMVEQMLTKFNPEVLPQVLITYKYVFALMLFALISHWMPDNWQNSIIKVLSKGGVILSAVAIAAVIFVIMQVKGSEVQPFIYFQF